MIRPLILTSHEIRQVAALKKTMHLLPVRFNRQTTPNVSLPCPYRPDAIHPIHTTPHDPAGLHVRIATATRLQLADLSYTDIRHLGHLVWPDFWHHYLTTVHHGYTRPDDDTDLERLFNRHHTKPVWLLSLQIAEGARFLAQRGDYTNDPREAIHGEPEPVDQATQEKITLGKLVTAEQRRRNEARARLAAIDRELNELDKLARADKRAADRVRLMRRNKRALQDIFDLNDAA